MPPLSLLIKPASGNCNLRCKYCFYHDLIENRSQKNCAMMDLELLELLVRKAFEYAEYSCTFGFQGGEPTLAGLSFYKKLIELEKKYNSKGIKVNYSIQTNGTLINDEWAVFLAQNHFLVGLSLDGYKQVHDQNRVDAAGKGSFEQVMKTVQLFNKYKVEYNILSVVNAYVAKDVKKIYQFFKENDFKYLQFIPCLDPLKERPGGHKYSLTPQMYADFLKKLFDCWYYDILKGQMVSVQMFDNYICMLLGYTPKVCGMLGQCHCHFVVEADGGVYPCDFYVIDEWCLGNIKNKNFDDLKNSYIAYRFIRSSQYIHPQCSKCRWFLLCRGGCRRMREPSHNGMPALNYYCSSFMEFFDYAFVRLQYIASNLK